MTLILCYVLLCCLIFWAKYWAIYKIYEQNLMIRYALCYAVLCCLMISLWKVSKILCPVMLCLWWHELKSKILWYVMLVLFVSKILCSVMNLTIYYVLFTRFLPRPARASFTNMYSQIHLNFNDLETPTKIMNRATKDCKILIKAAVLGAHQRLFLHSSQSIIT